jgi:putative ABC transport system permease protein
VSILTLARKSLWSRRATSALVVLTIAVSVALVLGVERLRNEARAGFTRSLAGSDLVVGARGGPLNLLLYAVFHVGDANNNIRWQSYQRFAQDPRVAWSVPLAFGDSHRGFPVVGTNADFFTHYHYGHGQSLRFASGQPMHEPVDAVLGAEVAAQLAYRLGQSLVLAHGTGEVSFSEHSDHPFTVVGILEPTGTPVDRAVHIKLEGIEAIHEHLQDGAHDDHDEHHDPADLTPRNISAFLLGLKSKSTILRMQRAINDYPHEPLLAILPGLTLQQLWDLLAVAENILRLIAALVVVVGLCVMLSALLTGLNERRREMAILRAMGAGAAQVFGLILGETLLLATAGIVLGVVLLGGVQMIAMPLLEARVGFALDGWTPSIEELRLVAWILGASLVAGLIPAFAAYRYALIDGMSARI